MEIYCTKCRYRKENGEIPKKCPYCDSVGTVREEKSMDELIKDIEED